VAYYYADSKQANKTAKALSTLRTLQADYVLVRKADIPAHLERDLSVMLKPMAVHCVEMNTLVKAAALLHAANGGE
jgi:hypothetical protein